MLRCLFAAGSGCAALAWASDCDCGAATVVAVDVESAEVGDGADVWPSWTVLVYEPVFEAWKRV